MADVRQYRQDPQINHGTTAQSNLKLTDIMPVQHENLATQTNSINKISLAQCLCEPYAVCNSNNPSNGQYTATCSNFPDFALSYTDSQGNSHDLVGLKVRVKFTYGVTYGSTTSTPPTCPTLNINGSGAIPMLAQGKTMGKGAISAEQTVEFTIIPYGNTLAFDADSNVRESTSDYTIYTDGKTQRKTVYSVQENSIYPVSSGAVAELNFIKDMGNSSPYTAFIQIPKGVYSITSNIYSSFTDKPNGANGRAIFICGASYTGADEQIAILCCASSGKMWLGYCYGGTPQYKWKQILS